MAGYNMRTAAKGGLTILFILTVMSLFGSAAYPRERGGAALNRALSRELSSRLSSSIVVYETKIFRIIASECFEGKVVREIGPGLVEAVDEFCRLFGADPGEPMWMGNEKGRIVLLKKRSTFKKYVALFKEEAGPDKLNPRFAKSVMDAQSFSWIEPWPYAVCCAEGKGMGYSQAKQHIFHLVGHILLTCHNYNYKFAPPWLHEGFGSYMAIRFAGGNILYCRSGLNSCLFGYGVFSGLSAWARSENWPGFMKQPKYQRTVLRLKELNRLELSEFDHMDAALSWSFVVFLIEKYPGRLRAYLAELKREPPGKGEKSDWPSASFAAEAFQKAFGMGFDEIEPLWREWVGEGQTGLNRVAGTDDVRGTGGKTPRGKRSGEKEKGFEIKEIMGIPFPDMDEIAVRFESDMSVPFLDLDEIAAFAGSERTTPEAFRSALICLVERLGCCGAYALLKDRLDIDGDRPLTNELSLDIALLKRASALEAGLFEMLAAAGVSFKIDIWPVKVELTGVENGRLVCTARKTKTSPGVLPAGCEGFELNDLGEAMEIRCPLSALDLKTFLMMCKSVLKLKSDEHRFGYSLFRLFRGDENGISKEIKAIKGMDGEKEKLKGLSPLYGSARDGALFLSVLAGEKRPDSGDCIDVLRRVLPRMKENPLPGLLEPRGRAIVKRRLLEGCILENRFSNRFKGYRGCEEGAAQSLFIHEFNGPAELESFDQTPPPLLQRLKNRFKVDPAIVPESFRVSHGLLACHGMGFITFEPVFDGEIELSLRFRISLKKGDDPKGSFSLLFGYGLDERSGYIASSGLAYLEIQPSKKGIFTSMKVVDDLKPVKSNEAYTLLLRGTAGEIVHIFNGSEERIVPANGLKKGRVFFWVYGPRQFEIERLEVRGRIDPDWIEEAIRSLVDEDLEDLL